MEKFKLSSYTSDIATVVFILNCVLNKSRDWIWNRLTLLQSYYSSNFSGVNFTVTKFEKNERASLFSELSWITKSSREEFSKVRLNNIEFTEDFPLFVHQQLWILQNMSSPCRKQHKCCLTWEHLCLHSFHYRSTERLYHFTIELKMYMEWV